MKCDLETIRDELNHLRRIGVDWHESLTGEIEFRRDGEIVAKLYKDDYLHTQLALKDD